MDKKDDYIINISDYFRQKRKQFNEDEDLKDCDDQEVLEFTIEELEESLSYIKLEDVI